LLKFDLKVDLNRIEKTITDRFTIGSEAQRLWSSIVFYGSLPYVPMVTGTFIKLSQAASTRLFAKGELLYPTEYAHFLWNGILMVDPETGSAWAQQGAKKVYTSTELNFNKEQNAKATSRWVIAAANDNLQVWLAEFERTIRENRV
jgi:hypothetical protein